MAPESATTKCPMAKIDSVSDEILRYIKKKLKQMYGDDKPYRAVHAKSIGLVEANFIIEKDLPDHLKIGLFKDPGKEYKAWIRFTNGDSKVKPDKGKHVRGMAIKVLDVSSTQYLDYDKEGNTQDFILFTSRISVPGQLGEQFLIPRIAMANCFGKFIAFIIAFFTNKWKAIQEFLKGRIKTPNILEEMYFSATPYSYGADKAKWHVRPLKTITNFLPENPRDNYLRERLISDLSENSNEEISFAFFVQFQENENTEPIEDPSVDWKTAFHRVATIILPKQDLDTDERKEKDKNMSFSPGHAIPEHAPLGAVNAVRRKVYETLAKERFEHPMKDKSAAVPK